VIAKKRVAAQGAVLHGNIALMSAHMDISKILITISETEVAEYSNEEGSGLGFYEYSGTAGARSCLELPPGWIIGHQV